MRFWPRRRRNHERDASGTDALGLRWGQTTIDDGALQVIVVAHPRSLTEPGIDDRVQLMARGALDNARTDPVPDEHQRRGEHFTNRWGRIRAAEVELDHDPRIEKFHPV